MSLDAEAGSSNPILPEGTDEVTSVYLGGCASCKSACDMAYPCTSATAIPAGGGASSIPRVKAPRAACTHRWVAESGRGSRRMCLLLHRASRPKAWYMPIKTLSTTFSSGRKDDGFTRVVVASVMKPDARDIFVDTGKKVIVKIYEAPANSETASRAAAELWALNLIASARDADSHVVELLDAMQDEKQVYLVMRYLDGGDLLSRVESTDGGLEGCEARKYFRHVVQGLLELKRVGIAHGNVCLENVLLSNTDAPEEEPIAHLIGLGGVCVSGAHTQHGYNSSHVHCSSSSTTPYGRNLLQSGGADRGDSEGEDSEGESDGFMFRREGRARKHTRAHSESSVRIDARTHTRSSVRPDAHRHSGVHRPTHIAPEIVNRIRDVAVGDRSMSSSSSSLDVHAVDVWALGLCLYQMLTGRRLYTDTSDKAFQLLLEGRTEDALELHEQESMDTMSITASFCPSSPRWCPASPSPPLPSSRFTPTTTPPTPIYTPTSSYTNTTVSGTSSRIDALAHDLLWCMLRPTPSARLTLDKILDHPWVQEGEDQQIFTIDPW